MPAPKVTIQVGDVELIYAPPSEPIIALSLQVGAKMTYRNFTITKGDQKKAITDAEFEWLLTKIFETDHQ